MFNNAKEEIVNGLKNAAQSKELRNKNFYKKYKAKLKFYNFVETKFKTKKRFDDNELKKYRKEFLELIELYFFYLLDKDKKIEDELTLDLDNVLLTLKNFINNLKNTDFIKINYLMKNIDLGFSFYKKYGIIKGNKDVIKVFEELKKIKTFK